MINAIKNWNEINAGAAHVRTSDSVWKQNQLGQTDGWDRVEMGHRKQVSHFRQLESF